MNKYLYLFITIIFFASCKKDSPVFPEGFDPNAPINYQPVLKSAAWTYITTDAAKNSISSTQTMTSNTVNISGKLYKEAIIKKAGDTRQEKVFFSVNKNIYTIRSESLANGMELEYLDENLKKDSSSIPLAKLSETYGINILVNTKVKPFLVSYPQPF